MRSFYEFFAGGGMARAGLGNGWNCLFSNDFDPKKGAAYQVNWGCQELKIGDVRKLSVDDLPGQADLAWASFPCQDLSLAGGGAGLKGERSGTFWPFWSHMTDLARDGRAPNIVALENVCGTLGSHGGSDFVAIANAFAGLGYRFGALVVDASLFLPHSRPRLFVISVKDGIAIPDDLICDEPVAPYHTRQLVDATANLPTATANRWLWWRLPTPAKRDQKFVDLLEDPLDESAWHTPAQTKSLLAMMSDLNRAKMNAAQKSGKRTVGCVYKRTRHTVEEGKIQRAEIRFDDLAGCLRTPAGGSSRQVIVLVEGKSVRSRLITARETARLMGLPDAYVLPHNYNEAYHLTGDGVAVPVVRFLAKHILEAIVDANAFSTVTFDGVLDQAA